MISLLVRWFIPNYKNTEDSTVRRRIGMLCSLVGIALNLLLALFKFIAGFLAHSISITADATNNFSDAVSSVITLCGFKLSSQKPDPDHPFGHGRYEYISGLIVSVVIFVFALELLRNSIQKIIHPQALHYSNLVLLILIVSILVKVYMLLYNRNYGNKLNSQTMKAVSTDSLGDVLTTSMVLICTVLSQYTSLAIDGYCGVLVSLVIFYAGYQAAMDTASPLLGQAPSPEFVEQVNQIVLSKPVILGIHDLIVHNYGPDRVMISLHVEVPSDHEFLSLHEIVDACEHDLKEKLHCSAVIHMDPVLVGDFETDRLKALVRQNLYYIDERITIHDFRIAKEPECTKLFFDVAVPYHFVLSDEELIHKITTRLQSIEPELLPIIEVDHSGDSDKKRNFQKNH